MLRLVWVMEREPPMMIAEQQLEALTRLIHLDVPLYALAPILRAMADRWEQPEQVAAALTPQGDTDE